MPKYITIKTYKRKIRDPVENKLSAKKAANARWSKYRQQKWKLNKTFSDKDSARGYALASKEFYKDVKITETVNGNYKVWVKE